MFMSGSDNTPDDFRQAVYGHGAVSNVSLGSPKCPPDGLVRHRVWYEDSTVEFEVKWTNGSVTWETEAKIQKVAPTLVTEYWKERGGRGNATGLELYHVLRILRVTNPNGKDEKRYLVQWVGYTDSEEDTTEESESRLRYISLQHLLNFKAANKTKVSSGRKHP
jgi:hypothetical protein